MGKRLTEEQLVEKKKLKKLIRDIRKSKKYLKWKNEILKRDVKSYPNVPANIQVHHLEDISFLIDGFDIKTLDDALNCKELWEARGITLTRGEHFILTKLNRYKYVTQGFIDELNEMIDNKFIKVDIDMESKVKKWKKKK